MVIVGLFFSSVSLCLATDVSGQGFGPQAAESVLIKRTYSIVA